LFAGGLRPDHRIHLQRAGLLDGRHPLQRSLHESVVDALLDQRPARTRAHLALFSANITSLNRLVEEIIVLLQYVGKKDVRRLPPSSSVTGIKILAGVLHDQPAVVVSP